jgi:hypothetical protein
MLTVRQSSDFIHQSQEDMSVQDSNRVGAHDFWNLDMTK